MDGIELIRKAKEIQPSLQTIVVTGHGDIDTAIQAVRLGASNYFRKPVSFEMLHESISGCLSKRIQENKLQKAEDKYRQIFNQSDRPMLLLEGDSIIECNPAAVSRLGFQDCQDLIHQKISDLTPLQFIQNDDDSRNLQKQLGVARKKEQHVFNWVLKTGQGEDIPMELTARSVIIDGEPLLLISFQDATDRQFIRKNLQAKSQNHQNLFENTPTPLFIHDLDGNFVDANPAAQALFEYDGEKFKKLSYRDLIHPSDLSRSLVMLTQIRQTGFQTRVEQYRMITGSKRSILVEIWSTIIYENNQPAGIMGIAREVQISPEGQSQFWQKILGDVLENFNLMFLLLDDEYQIKMLSAQQPFGYDLFSKSPVEGHHLLDFITQDYQSFWLQHLKRCFEGESSRVLVPLPAESEFIGRLECRFQPAANDKSTVINAAVVVYLLTPEQEETSARGLLDALMENIPDTIYFKDKYSRFTLINNAQARVLGVKSPLEAVGKSDFDFFENQTAEAMLTDELELFRTGRPVINKLEKLKGPRNHDLWVTATKVPVRDRKGQIQGMVGISRNVTAQKRAEEELQRYKQQLEEMVMQRTAELNESKKLIEAERDLFLTGPVAVINWELKPGKPVKATYASPNIFQFGVMPEDVLQAKFSYDTLLFPEDYERLKNGIRELQEGQLSVLENEVKVILPNSDERWIYFQVRIHEDAQQSDAQVFNSFFMDVSELKYAQMELQKQETKLAHTGRLALLGEMAAGIAHELNQPLSIVRGEAECLKLNLNKNIPPKTDILETCQNIMKQADRAQEIMEHARTFSTMAAEHQDPINIVFPIRDSLMFFREQFRNHGIIFKTSLPNDIPLIPVNPVRFEQIVVNFLSNARHAVEQRKSVAEKSYQMEIEIIARFDPESRCSYLEISDNGIGMDENELKHCRDSFFTTKSQSKGTGLGLTIVQNLMADFNGSLKIKSKPMSGTSVQLKIPIPESS